MVHDHLKASSRRDQAAEPKDAGPRARAGDYLTGLLPLIDARGSGIDERDAKGGRGTYVLNDRRTREAMENGRAYLRYRCTRQVAIMGAELFAPREITLNIPRGITREMIARHLRSSDDGSVRRLLVTGNGDPGSPKTLIIVDVDAKAPDDPDLARLQSRRFIGDYMRSRSSLNVGEVFSERSDGGSGAHAYLALRKSARGTSPKGGGTPRYSSAREVNEALNILESDMRQFLAEGWARDDYLQITGVEIRGTCLTRRVADDGDVHVTLGRLGKAPVTILDYAEGFAAIPNVDEAAIRALAVRSEASDLDLRRPGFQVRSFGPDPSSSAGRPIRMVRGSVAGHPIPRKIVERIGSEYSLQAHRLMAGPLGTTGRHVATVEDLAIILAILGWITANQGADRALPVRRIHSLWKAMYDAGDVARSPDFKRIAVLRNLLSAAGYIEWVECRYWVPDKPKDDRECKRGRCCRWSLRPITTPNEQGEARRGKRENTAGTNLPGAVILPFRALDDSGSVPIVQPIRAGWASQYPARAA